MKPPQALHAFQIHYRIAVTVAAAAAAVQWPFVAEILQVWQTAPSVAGELLEIALLEEKLANMAQISERIFDQLDRPHNYQFQMGQTAQVAYNHFILVWLGIVDIFE